MDRYEIEELRRLYWEQSQARERFYHSLAPGYAAWYDIEPLLPRQSLTGYSQRDEAHQPGYSNPLLPASAYNLADQIFNRQLNLDKLTVKQLSRLVAERTLLYNQVVRDIDNRHLEFQGQLYGAHLHRNLDNGRRALGIEKLLLELEQQRRQEQAAFWKDTTELRQALLEKAADYSATSQRARFLSELSFPPPAPEPSVAEEAPSLQLSGDDKANQQLQKALQELSRSPDPSAEQAAEDQ